MEQETLNRLAFFGRMNAHISHELKNILATISETAGLLMDLMDMYGVGKGPQAERLPQLCERIDSLVTRGNDTVRNMNRFAHSVDEPVKQIDLGELLELTASLSAYMPFARKVELDLLAETAVVQTRPFLVLNLLYACIAGIFPAVDVKTRLKITLDTAPDGARIILDPAPTAPQDVDDITERLGAKLRHEKGVLTIELPASLD